MLSQKDISQIMWALKGIAIVSVICAHVGTTTWNNIIVSYSSHILNNLGSIGVGIFYFISGYYYKIDTVNKVEFIKNKVKKLCIPWVIASTCIWLYVVLRKGDMTFLSYTRFVIGDGSIFYFMTNLLLYLFLFSFIPRPKKDKFKMALVLVIFAISQYFLILESRNICFFLTPYLDPLLFVTYFTLGYVFKDKIVSCIIINNKKWRRIIAFFSLIILISPMHFTYYNNGFSIIMELFFIYGMLNICLEMSLQYNRKLVILGKDSFAIYLWHIPVAGIVTNLMNRAQILQMLTLIRPGIVLLIVLGIMYAIKFMADKKRFLQFILPLLGLNDEFDEKYNKAMTIQYEEK